MKLEDIPQEADEIYEGETKIIYALDKAGKLTPSSTSGWEAEISVLKDALEELFLQAKDALTRAQRGETSPLEVHMYLNRMDLPMLAQAVGKFKWQVKRHFKPSVFCKLSISQLENYAAVLDIDITTLKQLPNLD